MGDNWDGRAVPPVDESAARRHSPAVAAEALDPELAKIAAQAKRRRRLILAVFAGNALVFAILVGGPYFRGRHRALAGREAFGELAACLWGGSLADDPGLSLPPGEELAYVDAFREAPEEWPMHCADELNAVPPDDIFWLFPDTRHAEGEVRRAAAMVRDEFSAAEGADRAGRVPSRPRLAVQRLQAALTLWSEEADVYVGLEDPLIAIPERAETVRPERVPLRAAEDATIWMEPRGDGLEIRAIDDRGISWVRVGGGRVDMRRLRKPSLVEAFGASERWPLLVWRTPDERCAPDCARQASGVAFLTDDTDITPAPIWLAAHPAGPAATHVRADGEGNVWVVADGVEEGASRELRAFPGALGEREEDEEAAEDAPDGDSGDEEPRPLAPETVTALPGYGPPVLLPEGVVHQAAGAPLLRGRWLAVRESGRTRVYRVTESESEVGTPESQSETEVGTPESEREVGTRESVGETEVGTPESVGDPLEPWGVIDEAPVGLALAGTDTQVALLLPRTGATAVFRCVERACAELGTIAGAEDPQVAVVVGAVVVAYDLEDDPQIRVARWDGSGSHSDAPAPAACTSDEGGFCGPAVIGARGGRLALGARDGSDLWVIESSDGATWQPLSGLR